MNHLTSSKEYFDQLALCRVKKRRAKNYYWNDLTRYCDYFIHEDHSVLEIGCGTGELLAELKAKDKTGIDFSENMILEAKMNFPHLDLLVMDAEDLALNKTFDVIILSNLIGYLPDIQKVFEQLHKVTHSGTKIIVSYYNFLWEPILKLGEMVGYKTKTPRQNWLSLAEINHLLYLSGFESFRNTRRMLFPVYIPLVSELFNNVFAKIPLFSRLCINSFAFAKPKSLLEPKIDFSVSVIIPARNEAGNIEELVSRMPHLGKSMELIFVESFSQDETWKKILDCQLKYPDKNIRVFQFPVKGKNAAVKKGFEEARGDIFMILDADMTVDPSDLPMFYNAIAAGKGDFIIGSRLVYPMEKEAMRFLNLLGNRFFGAIFSWLLDKRIKDTLCGTKVIFKKDYELLKKNRKFFGDFDPFGDFDLLFGAHKLNLSIVEVPVRYRERRYGRTNISRFRHGFLLLRMCIFAARKIKLY